MAMKKKAKTVRLGLVGYVRLLAILRTGPQSTVEFEAAAGIAHGTAHRILGSMHLLGMVHIAGWRMEADSPTMPQFIGFPGQDVPPPATRPNGRRVDGVRRLSAAWPTSELAAFSLLLKTLETPCTRSELAAATGLNDQTIRATLAALMKWRIARIALWTPRSTSTPGGPPMPNFQLGREASAHRPPRACPIELQRQYRSRRAARERAQPLFDLAVRWLSPVSASPANHA